MLLGVLDIGTNSIHMLIVRIEPDLRFRIVDRAKEMVRLGRSVFVTGRIDEASQKRALDALAAFRRLADRRGVHDFLAVATSAVREAENGGTFLQEVHGTIGVQPRIISGQEEARLVFRAVQSSVGGGRNPLLVVDLGGGSVEIAYGTAQHLTGAVSLKLGAQRLENMALRKGESTPEARKALVKKLEEELGQARENLHVKGEVRALVTSGSGQAALNILRAMGEIDNDETTIPVEALVKLDQKLADLSRSKRAKLPGLDPQRVDLIVGAVTFLRTFMETFSLKKLEASESGLREGVVVDYLDRHAAEIQWEYTEPNARRRAVLRFAEKLHYDAAHAHHVAHLATELFDDTRRLHGLGAEHRELLEFAALLHDVGYILEEKSHHKHSEYLILNGLHGGFTEIEVRQIAAIARYHRKVGPRPEHRNWAALESGQREAVRKAGALLRIADGLDRGHMRNVATIKATAGRKALRIDIKALEPPSLEVWAAKNKADLFEEVFGLPLELHAQVGTNGSAPPGGASRVVRKRKSVA